MRRVRTYVATLLVAAAGASAAPSLDASTTVSIWHAPQGGIMRRTELHSGEWVHTNTLWQARGANSDGLEREQYYANFEPDDPGMMTADLRRALTYEFFGAGRSVTNGDFELPHDRVRWPDGTGELAELRFQATHTTLFVRFGWHTRTRPQGQIATLLFGNGDGSRREWPANARLSSPWSVALTATSDGSELVGPDAPPVSLATTVADGTFEVRVPRALLPPGHVLTLRGGSGLRDPSARRYWDVPPGTAEVDRPGSGGPLSPTNVWGLLFASDDPWRFDERTQSRLLSAGDATAASTTVDLRRLIRRETDIPLVRGNLSRIYRSRYDGGDGIRRGPGAGGTPAPPSHLPVLTDFDVEYTLVGRLQDYSMRVPADYNPRGYYPLIVYLHGFGGTPEEPFVLPVGLVEEAERRGYLFASLHGRGDLFYRGIGELDVVEAIGNMYRHYRIEPARVHLMGHSMGGFGTNNIAVRYPDLFASVAPFQGIDSVELAPNLRHVPWQMVTGDFDLDGGGVNAERHYAALSALGYDATLVHYRFKTHEYSSVYDTLPRLFTHFAASRVVRDPSVVTWVSPRDDQPKLGLVHDGAYWLSGVRTGRVTAVSHALPRQRTDNLDPATARRDVVDPSDEGGPSGRTLAVLRTTRADFPPVARLRNQLDVTSTGAGRVVVDAARARLRYGSEPLRVCAPADAVTVAFTSGIPTVRVPAGQCVSLTATDRGDPRGPLPATGATPPLVAVIASATALLLARARRRTGAVQCAGGIAAAQRRL